MCRRVILLIVLCFLVGFGTHVFAASFSDVSGTIYEDAFAYLSENGAVRGYPDGFGRPTGPLNRVEALKVILAVREGSTERLEYMRTHMPPIPLFSDINQSTWYAPYVEVAFENGIVKGYPDGTFRPTQFVRVEEAIALLMRSFGEDGSDVEAKLSSYIENRAGGWFTPYINAAIEKNLIMHRGTLRLGNAITRGQFFDMVYRMHTVQSKDAVAFTGVEPDEAPQPSRARGTVQANVSDSPYASERYFAISMPSLGIEDLAVNHPQDPFSKDGVLVPLKHGVGHLFSYPGAGGKVMIYGHSSGYPWDVSKYTKIFRRVNELEPGDLIYITYEDRLYTYEVTHEEAIPSGDTSRFNDDGTGEQLILYTCWPPDSISQRYLVFARPVDAVAVR